MNPDLPDYSRSTAFLIGVSDYADPAFPQLPAAANSLERMRDVLSDPRLCGWPPERITVLRDPIDVRRVTQQLRRAARQTLDVFLFYYVGHGTITPGGELCLTLTDTDAGDSDITGIEYRRIKEALLDSPARMKAVILDCCYSGRAIEALADPSSVVADSTDTRGTYTLTASDQTAHVVPFRQQSSVCTTFTGELVDLIRTGVPVAPAMLTLDSIYVHLRRRLLESGRPHPNKRGTDTADLFAFSRNIATMPSNPIPGGPANLRGDADSQMRVGQSPPVYGGSEHVGHSGLRHPSPVAERDRTSQATRGPADWNGTDYYVLLEDDVPRWDDAHEWGYVYAGGESRWSKPLFRLEPGARVFVHLRHRGYVAVGRVLAAPVPIGEFIVNHGQRERMLLDVPLRDESVK